MKRVLVVCGAGASSTFLAHRMRRLATQTNQQLTVEAGSESDLSTLATGVDVVLVGPHLGGRFREIEDAVAREGATAVLLPPTAFSPRGAADAMKAVDDALPSARPSAPEASTSTDRLPAPLHTLGAHMAERTVRIASSHGLHARPASLFTQAAAKSGVPVQIAKAGKSVNAASILGVISLGIDHGDEVVLTTDANAADGLLDELAAMLENDLDKE
jgi:phosphotransferase system HPr (HPr) family protein